MLACPTPHGQEPLFSGAQGCWHNERVVLNGKKHHQAGGRVFGGQRRWVRKKERSSGSAGGRYSRAAKTAVRVCTERVNT